MLPHPIEDAGGFSAVRVNDYQPSRVSRAEANNSPSHQVHHGEDTGGDWFQANELHTGAAYIETEKQLPDSWQNKQPKDVHVSINEDGITLTDVRVLVYYLRPMLIHVLISRELTTKNTTKHTLCEVQSSDQIKYARSPVVMFSIHLSHVLASSSPSLWMNLE